MLSKFVQYWKSKRSNFHGLIALLSGATGLATVEMLGFNQDHAKLICGVAIVVGSLLFTPDGQ